MRKLTIIAALALLIPVASQADTLEDLLVEKGVITKSDIIGAMGGGAKVYWNKGTRLDFADSGFTAKIQTQLQTRYEYTDFDQDDTSEKDNSNFDVRRAKLIVSGSALHEEFEYRLQANFVGSEDGDGADDPDLEDAYLKWNFCDWGGVKMGQFKTPVSRQYNNSSGKLQFADRSVASNYYAQGRNRGAEIAGGQGSFSWGAAIFNGNSDGEGQNRDGQDTRHMGAVKVRWDAMGEMNAYEEGDVNRSDAALNFGAAYSYSDDKNATAETTETHTASVDANFKSNGLSVHAEGYWNDFENDVTLAEYDTVGGYAQAGYMFTDNFEGAARYAFVDCDNGRAADDCSGNDNLNEVSVSLNYYWWKHHLKAQLGYVFLNEDPAASGPGVDDINTNRWLLQLSSYF